MPNMKSMINKQNTSRLNNSDNKVDAKQCNCRSDKNCPLNGKCCRNSVVYKASLKTDETDKFYYGSCENILKLYPVKKFTVLIFNSYPNNCHFKRISLESFYRISNVQTI